LHREGGKYPDSWHFNHMLDPTTMSPGSIMPRYPWFIRDEMSLGTLPQKIKVLRTLGTPDPAGYEDQALADLQTQAAGVADRLIADGIEIPKKDLQKKEIVALIAYLQRLGTDIKPKALTAK
jgi:cytochrome c oxidase cbb3-type subunit I/II